MTGMQTLTPKAPDTKQAVVRSPFACARRRREKSIRFKKLVALSLAWEEAVQERAEAERRAWRARR
jgi:hypothetical protein